MKAYEENRKKRSTAPLFPTSMCSYLFEVVLGIHNIVLGYSSGYAKTKIIALNVDHLAVVF